jgi:hypothetical protein
MIVVGLIEEILGILNGLLAHFVTGGPPTVSLSSDYEWALGPANYTLTTKGDYLVGAVADITTYGAILVDWVVQALLGTGTNVNEVAT